VKTRFLLKEQGSALIEAVTFVTAAFLLLLGSALGLFEVQRQVLVLETLARNVLRSVQLDPELDLQDALIIQAEAESISLSEIVLSTTCLSKCDQAEKVLEITLESAGVRAKAFGVVSSGF